MFKHRHIAIGGALAAAGALTVGVATQGAAAAGTRTASASTIVLKLESVKVAVGTSNRAHQVLVNASGRPVYMLTGDSAKHPLCESSACLGAWPAVTSSTTKPHVGRGVKGKVGIWHHGHVNQLTLGNHPLYTYAADSPGAALGEGFKSFGGVWELLAAGGSPLASSAHGSSSSGGW